MDPIKFPQSYKQDESENKIKSLIEDLERDKLPTLLANSKSDAAKSLRWGVIIIVLSLVALIALAFISKREPTSNSSVSECACSNGKLTCATGCCPLYDWSIYGFVLVALIGLGLGWILLKNYVTASKKISELNDRYFALSDLRVVWEMSKGLADWVEGEPETITEETKNQEPKAKQEGGGNTSTSETKKTIKGKEYAFPRQRAQQQIIETLLARI